MAPLFRRPAAARGLIGSAALFVALDGAHAVCVRQSREQTSAPRVSVEYVKSADRTDVSLTLVPALADGSRPPFRLLLNGSHSGKVMRRPPSRVQVNAQPHPLAVVKGLTFVFSLDGRDRIDLTAPGRSYSYTYPCDGCGPTGIVAQASVEEIARLASAARLDADILGFAVRFTSADGDALEQFVARLTPEPDRPAVPRIVPPVMEGKPPH